MNRRVIVLGGVHHNTLGVVRALGQKGLQEFLFVILIGKSENNLISVSKYINKGHCFTTEKFEDLIPLLMELKQENEKSVVITTADPIAYILDKQYDNLSRYFILPNINQQEGKIAEAENKDFQSELAQKCGINVPISLSFEKESVFSTIENWDYYPCILKPIDSINGGKNDIHICNNATEIMNNATSSICPKLQLQEYIDKDFEFQLIGLSLNSGNTIIIPGFTKIIRQPNNTNTGYLKYCPIEKLDCDINKVKNYIKEHGYSGLFSIEFIKGKDGKDFFLEINMRNDGNAFVVTTAGVNLPYLWYYFCCNGTLPAKEPISFKKTVYFMPEFSDFTNVIKGKTNIFTWIKQAYNADCCAVFHAKDRRPFWCELKNYCYRAINKITKVLQK